MSKKTKKKIVKIQKSKILTKQMKKKKKKKKKRLEIAARLLRKRVLRTKDGRMTDGSFWKLTTSRRLGSSLNYL